MKIDRKPALATRAGDPLWEGSVFDRFSVNFHLFFNGFSLVFDQIRGSTAGASTIDGRSFGGGCPLLCYKMVRNAYIMLMKCL